MEKEKVHVKKVKAVKGINDMDALLNLNFEENENDEMGISLEVGIDRDIIPMLKKIFKVEKLSELEGMEITLAKKENDWPRILGIGVDGENYIYKRGNSRARLVDETNLERLVNSDIEPKVEKEDNEDYIM